MLILQTDQCAEIYSVHFNKRGNTLSFYRKNGTAILLAHEDDKIAANYESIVSIVIPLLKALTRADFEESRPSSNFIVWTKKS